MKTATAPTRVRTPRRLGREAEARRAPPEGRAGGREPRDPAAAPGRPPGARHPAGARGRRARLRDCPVFNALEAALAAASSDGVPRRPLQHPARPPPPHRRGSRPRRPSSAACRASPSGPRAPSTAPPSARARCGRTATTRARCARRARCATPSSTCCTTGRRRCPAPRASTRAPRGSGSTAGRGRGRSGACRQPTQEPPVRAARTWLLATGWRRHGLIGFDEHPQAPPG